MTCMASSERQPFPSRLSFTLRKRGLLHLLCSWWGNKERRAAGPGEGPSGNHERRESARGGPRELHHGEGQAVWPDCREGS